MSLFSVIAKRLVRFADILAEGSTTVVPNCRYAPGYACMPSLDVAASTRPRRPAEIAPEAPARFGFAAAPAHDQALAAS